MGTERNIDAAAGHARMGRQAVRLAHLGRRRSRRLRALAACCLLALSGRGAPLRSADADFRRGDANGDGPIDIADAVATLGFLFQGGALVTCLDAADANDDGEVSLADAVATLGTLFRGEPALPGPGPGACGSDPTGDAIGCESYALCPPGGTGKVGLDLGSRASATIGPAGGTLESRGADGTLYRLAVPEDALAVGTPISMTPVSAIDGYPLAAGVAAGVDFAPAGLVFAAPARLTIETAKAPPGGTTAVALTYEGDAESYAQTILGREDGALALAIEHFSGGTVGFATAAELEALAQQFNSNCLAAAIAPASADPPDFAAAVAVFRGCFQTDVLPAITGATTDEQLAAALGKLQSWRSDARLAVGLPSFDDSSEIAQAQAALVPKLREAITRNNDRCEAEQSFASLANVLFWQGQAQRFGVDTPENLLERGQILLGLCARAVVESTELPQQLQVGFPHSLDLRFGMVFGGQGEPQGAPFRVQIVADGLDIQNPTGFTNLQGEYTTVVTATREGGVFLTATACLVIPGTTQPTDVCVPVTLSRGGQEISGLWGGRITIKATEPDGFVTESRHNVELDLEQNQNAISGRFEICERGGGAFAATLSGDQLLNVSLDDGSECFVVEGAGTVIGNDMTFQATGICDGDTLTITVEAERGDDKC